MKKIRCFIAALLAAFFLAVTPARADPISAVITAVTAIASWLAAGSVLAKLTIYIGMSLLSKALTKKPKSAAQAGIKGQTSSGGTTGATFIIGTFATSGHLQSPVASYGEINKTPNAMLVYVIALGCKAGQTRRRLILNGAYVPIGTTPVAIPGSSHTGFPIQGEYAGRAWMRFHDGDQTTADAYLLQTLGGHPDRPWLSDMVGYGTAYAIMVFQTDRELYNNLPTVRFEEDGIPLYDPRKDSSVGGSGTHRWDDPATWEHSRNNRVMAYNILRGITLPDGFVWGGRCAAEDLPFDNWVAAMNACDVLVDDGKGGMEPAYISGQEINVDEDPADYLDQLDKAACAQTVEMGGVYKTRVGGPGLPVLFITDDDILIDHPRNKTPFPEIPACYNGVSAQHPLPEDLWENADAPVLLNPTWEAEDRGQRRVAPLTLPASPSATQTQRIMAALAADNRRFVTHHLSFGPYASMLEPLDAIAWTSARHGYSSKVFEVETSVDNLQTLNIDVGLRERDSNDFTPPMEYLPWPVVNHGTSLPVAQAVPGFAVAPVLINDATGAPRRPAVAITWDPEGLLDARAVMWEGRVKATAEAIPSGSSPNVAAGGVIISDGLIGATTYEFRGLPDVNRPTNWTGWAEVTTHDVRLGYEDLAPVVIEDIETNFWEIVKLRADVQTQAIISEARAYDGDGKTVQYKVREAVIKADGAMTRLNILGALLPDASAFVLDMAKVQVSPALSFASYMAGVSAELTDLNTGLSGQVTATNLLEARVEATEGGLETFGELLNGLSLQMGEVSGQAHTRYTVQTVTGGDVTMRIQQQVRAEIASTWVAAADVLEAGFVGGNPLLPFARKATFVDNWVLKRAGSDDAVSPFEFDLVEEIFAVANIAIKGDIFVSNAGQGATLREYGYKDVTLRTVALRYADIPLTNDVRTFTATASGTAGYRLMMEFYHNRPDLPISQRIRSGTRQFQVTANAEADTYFSTWYQVLNAARTSVIVPLTRIGYGQDRDSGRGDVSANGAGETTIPSGGVLQIYISVRDGAGSYQPGGDNDYSIRNGTVTCSVINN